MKQLNCFMLGSDIACNGASLLLASVFLLNFFNFIFILIFIIIGVLSFKLHFPFLLSYKDSFITMIVAITSTYVHVHVHVLSLLFHPSNYTNSLNDGWYTDPRTHNSFITINSIKVNRPLCLLAIISLPPVLHHTLSSRGNDV